MIEGNPASSSDLVAVDSSEVVARALFPPQWDERVQRGSVGCFKRNNTSVTRHNGLTFEQVVSLLKSDVETATNGVCVRAVGLISVGEIKQIGHCYQDPVHFEVFEKKTPKNSAHAEIMPFEYAANAHPNKEVSKGLSRQLSNALDIYVLTPEGVIEGRSLPQRTIG